MINKLSCRGVFEVALTLLDKLFLLFGTFVTLKLLSIYASKEDFGLYSLGISLFVIISMFPFTAIDAAVTRYFSIYQEQGKWPRALVAISWLFVALILIYAFLSLIIYFSPVAMPGVLEKAYLSIMLFSLVEILRISLLNIENSKRHRAINTASNGLIYISRCWVIYYLGDHGALTISLVFEYFSLLSLMNVFILVFIQRRDFSGFRFFSWKCDKKIWAEILHFSTPMIIWGPFIWAQNMINRWLLGVFYNEEVVAEFVAVNAIATLIPTATFGVLWALMTPILYKMENQKKGATQSLNRFIQPLFAFLLLSGFLLSYFFSERILLLAFGEQYVVGAWLLPILYIPAALIQWAAYGSTELFAVLQTKKLLMPNIVPGVFSLVLGYILIISFPPLIAAAINAVFTGLLYYCLMMFVVRSHRKVLE